MSRCCPPYPLIPIPDFEPQTKGIVRQNAPQRLSLAVAPLMTQRSILFRVRTELGEELSDSSDASSLQLVSAQPGPSDASSSSTASIPSSSRGPELSLREPPSSSLSSASVYSQESYLLASSKYPLTGANLLTPAVATATSATLAIPLSVHTPFSARAGKAMLRTPLSSAKPRLRPRLRPRSARSRARRRDGAKGGDDDDKHRRFAMAFSPSVALPWEALILGGDERSPVVSLEIGGLRASRGYADEGGGLGGEEVDGTWEDEPESEDDDGSTTPKTGDPRRWIKAPASGQTGDEGIRLNGISSTVPRRRPQSIIRSKLRAKGGHQRTLPGATDMRLASNSPMPVSSVSETSASSSIIIANLPRSIPLRRALSRMTVQPALRNEKADLPTGLRRTKSQLLSPIADTEAVAIHDVGMSLDALSIGFNTLNLRYLKDSLAQYWSPAIDIPNSNTAGVAGPGNENQEVTVDKVEDGQALSLKSSHEVSPSSQVGPQPSNISDYQESDTPSPLPGKPDSLQLNLTSTFPSSFPAPPLIPVSIPHRPPPSPAPASFHRKGHKRYLSSPAILNFRPSDLPTSPPPMPDLKEKLAQLDLLEGNPGKEKTPRIRATARVSFFRSMEKRERLEEKKVLRKSAPVKKRSPGAKHSTGVERVSVLTKEMIGAPLLIHKHGDGGP